MPACPSPSPITRRYGSWRGAVRSLLAHAQQLAIPAADLRGVDRAVFVCHGNICRSAYAEGLAHARGVSAASLGLSTTTGLPAHPPVVAAAAARGLDLGSHRTTAVADFVLQPGDLLLAMEVRQLVRLRRDPRFAGARLDLLGRFAGSPHLHDPYSLNAAYLDTCLTRIDLAVATLADRLARRG